MKTTLRINLLVLFLLATAVAHAQGGCIDSPENPTALLAVVGTAGGVCCFYPQSFTLTRSLNVDGEIVCSV